MPMIIPARTNPIRLFCIGVLACNLGSALMAQDGGNIIISHGISPFGDLKYPKDFTRFNFVDPTAPKGGRMIFRGTGASQTFDTLNPFILQGTAAQGMELIYDTLMTGAPDDPGAVYGLVAHSVEYPKDRSWAVFNLRPEARFADNSPITADDVVFTYDILIKKGSPSYRIILKDIEKVEALSPQKVKFTFKADAHKRDLPIMVAGLQILPRHYYDKVDFAAANLTPPLGSGAYEIKRVIPGKSIEYCRIPNYWAKDLPVRIGTQNFDCVTYEYFADRTAAFEAFKAGSIYFQQEFSARVWATAYNFPALEKGRIKREELDDNTPSGTQGFWFNLRREKFQDPRVREAIGMMFNFEWTNNSIFYGLYKRTDSFFENSPLQAEGLPEGEELTALEPFRDRLPAEIFTTPPYVPPVYKEDQQLDRKALRQASKLLDEAGWKTGPDGIRRNSKNEPLTIEFLDDETSMGRIINPFVANLRQLGVDARFNVIDAAQIQDRQQEFDYDVIGGRFAMSQNPSVELRQLFSSQAATSKGSANLSGVADPVIDGLVEQIIAATDRKQLDGRVKALDRVLRHKRIWIPNWYSGKYLIAYWDMFGRPAQNPPYARGDGMWWVDSQKLGQLKEIGALK